MLKIATHDSATGEKPKNLLSVLVVPFACTQSKTIAEQYNAGCRSFDLRIKKVNNQWHCAHGIWISKRTFIDILQEINNFVDSCYVSVTYEGSLKNNDEIIFIFNKIKEEYTNIIWGALSIKYGKDSTGIKVKYDIVVKPQPNYIGGKQGFLPLDGRSWHTYLPIPWLWYKLHFAPNKFNDEYFTFSFNFWKAEI